MSFVETCRRSAILAATNQFDRNIWESAYRKGKGNKTRIVFSTHEAACEAKPSPTPALPEPFLSFAKAILTYLQDRRPVVSQQVRLSALRYLEAALRRKGQDARPTGTDALVLDTAVQIARESVSPSVAYRAAGQLELLAETMQELGVIKLRGRWEHGLKKPAETNSRISEEALTARQEKLPSAAVIRAVAGIFNDAQGVADDLVSSYCALMLCAPERVNEVMRLEVRCLVDGEGRYQGKLGIRWPGSKLSDDTTKWLPSHMAPLAREVIARLEKTSAPARAIADWYMKNPRRLFLNEDAAHLRGVELVSAEEVGLILWGPSGSRTSATVWIKGHGLSPARTVGRKFLYRFADVESAVLSLLPETFPEVPGAPGLECRASLALCLMTELHAGKSPYTCMFQLVTQDDLYVRLGSQEHRSSIFDRYGYTEDDGSPMRVTSHAFRHYLNTLAQLGGLSDTEIAIFSGRKDVRQNRAYDHLTSDQVLAPIIKATAGGYRAELVLSKGRELYTRSELLALGKPASHTTEFGYCMLDFAAEPCQMHRDCVNCDEQECVKGEQHKEENLRRSRSEAEQALARARAALTDEEYGADKWVTHYVKTLGRIGELLSVLENPAVPVGARIRLAKGSPPQVRLADGVHPIKLLPR
ncbi:integrase [Roseateles sp. NT4]|uniref:integrase n=1 Tax=Roseateles sp. NT4 TaxID=3453715 RepID=UPI003F6FCEA5